MQNQTFYRALQAKALEPIGLGTTTKLWADIGCSTGLMSRLASKLNYKVMAYDLNSFSLFVAKLLSFSQKNITYQQKNLYDIDRTFEIITATSLLSVVENKEEALQKLLALLKGNASTLIIIEPSEKLSVKNVWKLIDGFKNFWFYKGLLVWAKAREGKDIDTNIFDDLVEVKVSHTYSLEGMVRITYVCKNV